MSSDIETYIYDLSRELHIEDTQGVFGNELELIALVKNCPFLYDKSRNDFKDLEKRESTWRAISSVMHGPVQDCQARWKSLREQYRKIKRAVGTGDPESERLMQWEFFDDMKFLDQHIRPRRCLKRNPVNTMFKTEQPDQMIIENLDEESYNIEWLDEPKLSENRELKLINLVKLCPLLYDKNHTDNKDPHKKDIAWMSIGKQLGSPALDCKTRWKTLRERYARERKMYKADPQHKLWEYYNDMCFLDKHVRARRSFRTAFRPILPKPENFQMLSSTTSGVVLNPDDIGAQYQVQKLEFVDSTFDTTVPVDGDENICMSPTSATEGKSDQKNIISSVISPSSSMNAIQDEDDLFGQSIAAELKRIHGRRKKMRLKANIFKLLCEAESEESN